MLSEPPSDPLELAEWRLEIEERFAAQVTEALIRIVVSSYERFLSTLTAAGDMGAFDSIPQEWNVYIAQSLIPDLDEVYKSGALTAWNIAPTTENLPISAAQGWSQIIATDAIDYQAQASNRLTQVGHDVWLKTNSQVTDALAQGASPAVLRKEIEQVTQFSKNRADAIARTEMNSAFVNGAYQGEVALGEYGPRFKEWSAAGDARTRPDHQDANGTVVAFDEPFNVGGEDMQHPHDVGASAEQNVNCRCATLFYYVGDTLPDGTLVEDTPSVAQAVQIDQLQSTEELYLDRSGGYAQYKPSRVQDVHEPFVQKLLSKGVRRDDPIVTFMGGGSGAGKGSVQKAGFIKPRSGTVVVDSDQAKLGIPEYKQMVAAQDKRAAAIVHNESSFMAARAMSESIESGFDTVLDGTGDSSIEKISAKVADARTRGGQRLIGEYVTIDTDEAIARATARAERTGREVPRSIVTRTHESVSTIFPQIVDRNLFDELRLWDNMGDTPELIFEMKNGVATVLNADRYEAFLRKSPSHPKYIPT